VAGAALTLREPSQSPSMMERIAATSFLAIRQNAIGTKKQ
jgi:hypothetical protein